MNRIQIPTIPPELGVLTSAQYPGLVSGGALCFLTDDLVYDAYGYSGDDLGDPISWYGPAAEFAKALAPLCVWPCTFELTRFEVEKEGSDNAITIEITCPENPWLAPDVHRFHTPRDGRAWTEKTRARNERLTGGIIEALAAYHRTGHAVLPRWISEDHMNRSRWVDGKKHRRFYPRIQELESGAALPKRVTVSAPVVSLEQLDFLKEAA